MNKIIELLRDTANELEHLTTQKIEVPAGCDLVTAVQRLREVMPEGRISVTVSWDKYGKAPTTRFDVMNDRFKTIGDGKTLHSAMTKAIAAITPEPAVDAVEAIEQALPAAFGPDHVAEAVAEPML